MKTRTISIRVSEKLYGAILGAAGKDSVTSWILKAVEERLNGGSSGIEKASVRKGSGSVGSAGFMDGLESWLEAHPDWLNELPGDQAARIAAQIFPKLADRDMDAEKDALSLKESLSHLPLPEDLTRELSRVKGELFKAEHERDFALSLLKKCGDAERKRAFMALVLGGVKEIVFQWLVRESYSGMGSGGGLTEEGKERVAKEALRFIEQHLEAFS